MSLFISHTGGFFSCCSVKLSKIIKYINSNNKLPTLVDSSKLFDFYKGKNKNIDITYDYFEHYSKLEDITFENDISFSITDQYKNFYHIDYNKISPILRKYFTPSKKIIDNMERIKNLYNIDYENSIAVYYRGTDKKNETKMVCFNEYLKIIKKLRRIDSNRKIIVQTDTAQFLDYIQDNNIKNVIVIKENKISYHKNGIHKEKNNYYENYNDIFHLFSTFLILSKCKYIICGPSNCSLWMMLYRGNNTNVCQKFNKEWIINLNYQLHTFGDGFSREPWINICKDHNIKINHIDSLSCYSFGNKDLKRINISDPKYNINEGDFVCFSLGEIDCRCYIHKFIHERDYKDIIIELVEKYMRAININKNLLKNINICVLSLPPVLKKIKHFKNKNFPFVGSDEVRRAFTCFFNENLRKMCKKYNFIYINIYKNYLGKNKFLDEKYKNEEEGNVYIKDPEILLQELHKHKILKKIKY